MSITTTRAARTTRRRAGLALGATAAGFLLVCSATTSPAVAVAPVHRELPPSTRSSVPCTIDPSLLPRTADAAAAWMASCYEPDQHPRTADATVAWLQ